MANQDLAAGDHFAGMPESTPVSDSLSDSLPDGNLHEATRNELSDFVQWLIDRAEFSEVIYEALNEGTDKISREIRDRWAHEYFVELGYEEETVQS